MLDHFFHSLCNMGGEKGVEMHQLKPKYDLSPHVERHHAVAMSGYLMKMDLMVSDTSEPRGCPKVAGLPVPLSRAGDGTGLPRI